MNSALASTLVAMMVAAANAQASINGGQYSRTADYVRACLQNHSLLHPIPRHSRPVPGLRLTPISLI